MKMMLKTRFSVVTSMIAATLMLGASAAHADDSVKIGTVDMQRALQTVDAGKKAKAQLEKDFNAKKHELQGEETSIKKMGEEFKKQAAVMNEDARAKKQAEIQERIMKFQENTARSQADIQQKERELTQPIITKLRTVIADLAKSRGYTVVLEKSENVVLYSLDKDDLTADVVASYNKANKTQASGSSTSKKPNQG
jgi:outer membrane protein